LNAGVYLRSYPHKLVTLMWVPGHSNIYGNEMADELARAGSDQPANAPHPVIPLSRGWANAQVNDWVSRTHKIYWRNLPSCRQTKLLIDGPIGRSEAARLRGLNKQSLRTLVGVISGHFFFKKHLFNLGVCSNTICERCLEDEDTAYHLICLCPRLAQRRLQILGNFVLSEQDYKKLSIRKIQSFISVLTLEPVL
jgi:hypothetical protein